MGPAARSCRAFCVRRNCADLPATGPSIQFEALDFPAIPATAALAMKHCRG